MSTELRIVIERVSAPKPWWLPQLHKKKLPNAHKRINNYQGGVFFLLDGKACSTHSEFQRIRQKKQTFGGPSPMANIY